ncbi:hypothetical protein JTB14_035508 [Gonioctena quinquepunctata]|nr:hypothetical protein JTB14_035508 [Gonioctena quinquepunctata]
MAYRLKNLEQDIDDEMMMSKISSERFKYFNTAWDSSPSTDKTLTKLISRLIAEEVKSEDNGDGGAVASNAYRGKKGRYKSIPEQETQRRLFYPMVQLYEDLEYLKQYVVACHNLYVSKIRSDNGGEEMMERLLRDMQTIKLDVRSLVSELNNNKLTQYQQLDAQLRFNDYEELRKFKESLLEEDYFNKMVT